jgi:5-methylcytosine-specific restriction endonuclease McrA
MVDFETWMLTQEDHLVALKGGGAHDTDNRVIACYVCNKLKKVITYR